MIPDLTFPALPMTDPDGILTALPFVVVDCVNDACVLSANPDVASEALNPAVWVPRHQPSFPGRSQESLLLSSSTVGAPESIVNGPASMPGLTLPALSLTDPDGILTALPFVVVDCVNDACELSANPDVASEALNPAVCVPRHQPPSPTTSQESLLL